MDGKTLALIYKTVQEGNILPITTICNVRCLFCSHHQNPAEVQAVAIPPLKMDIIEDLIGYLDGSRKIIIGESTSLIMEGEPLTHPYFFECLSLIRQKFSNTTIQVTTNGAKLTEENIIALKALEPIELILSLNTADVENRKMLMHDVHASIACAAPPLLKKHQINYHGSIVAMPHILGWDDLDLTVAYLINNGAKTVRIFKPGFTRLTDSKLIPTKAVFEQLESAVALWQRQGKPVTLEPAQVDNLDAIIAAVIPDSPAYAAGIQANDIICAINQQSVFSRVDAYHRLKKQGIYHLQLKRNEHLMNVELQIPGDFSGLIFNYDLHPDQWRALAQIVQQDENKRYLMLCSSLAYPIWQRLSEQVLNLSVMAVTSQYFGGNIAAAGLLTIEDFDYAYKQYNQPVDYLILPAIAFNHQERDLAGQDLWQWAEAIQQNIILF